MAGWLRTRRPATADRSPAFAAGQSDIDKVAPAVVAASALDALEAGEPEAVVDELSRQVKAGLSDDQRALYPQIEQEFAGDGRLRRRPTRVGRRPPPNHPSCCPMRRPARTTPFWSRDSQWLARLRNRCLDDGTHRVRWTVGHQRPGHHGFDGQTRNPSPATAIT